MSSGGAVAAALLSKKKGSEIDSDDAGEDSDFSESSIENLVLPASDPALSAAPIAEVEASVGQAPSAAIESQAVKMLQKAPTSPLNILEHMKSSTQESADRKSDYASLIFFLVYLSVFLVISVMQSRSEDVFTVTNAHSEFLFSESSGTVSFSDGRIKERIQSLAIVEQWIEKTLIDGVFVDPVCGDGLCERPLEYPSIFDGRFGCSQDCGVYPNTTVAQIEFTVDEADSQLISGAGERAGWNLCWSAHGFNICYYAQFQKFFDQSTQSSTTTATDTNATTTVYTHTVSLMDGQWDLRMKGDLVIPGRVKVTSSSSNITSTLKNWTKCVGYWDESQSPFGTYSKSDATNVYNCPSDNRPSPGGGGAGGGGKQNGNGSGNGNGNGNNNNGNKNDERRLAKGDDEEEEDDDDDDDFFGGGGKLPSWFDFEYFYSNCDCDHQEVDRENCCKEDCNKAECYYAFVSGEQAKRSNAQRAGKAKEKAKKKIPNNSLPPPHNKTRFIFRVTAKTRGLSGKSARLTALHFC